MGDFLDKAGLGRVKAKIDAALATKLNVSLKGVANGVAELNENGNVPLSQLPSMIGATSFSDGESGFVTAAIAGEENKYLKGDGTWDTPSEMLGATSSAHGEAGLVPAPLAGDENKFLKGDGTWMDIYALPDPPIADGTYTLQCVASNGSIYYEWVQLFDAEGESF